MNTPAIPQYVIWRRAARADGGVDKLPCNPRGEISDAHDPRNWLDEPTARAIAQTLGAEYGIGFVFTDADPYFFVDLDHVREPDRAAWQPIALDVLRLLPGCAVEVSQSGAGLHIIGRGIAPADRKIQTDQVSLYTSRRFCAFGPYGWTGDAETDATPGLEALAKKYLQRAPDAAEGAAYSEGRRADWCGPTSDEALLGLALKTRPAGAVFGGVAVSFADLWTANAAALGARWPSEGREYDASSADAALAQHLAFWTGCDAVRMESLMRRSGLVRDKWAERRDYLPRTIANACAQQRDVYCVQTKPKPEPAAQGGTAAGVPGVLPVESQIDYFAGCVYVYSEHKIWTPTGKLLKPESFRVAYGGYQFALSADMRRTTRNAFDAFVDCQAHRFPRVDGIFFDPRLPPGEIVEDRINTFYPRWGARQKGDPALWLEHLRRLVPNDNDRETLQSYLAACVQMAGQKFQWAPVLQGVDGNGKTIFYEAVEYALGRDYCHQQNPNDLDNNFNAWIERKLFVCVEEIRTAARHSLADAIKPLITNQRLPVQGKGRDQCTGDNVANFLFFSNHKDAVLKTENDRRYCVIYTAHQKPRDLVRDRMGPDYFARLFGWLRGGGKAVVADWLWTYPISVNLMGRAPETSSTAEARVESLGAAEQVILEAIDLEQNGFTADLIDLAAASDALSKIGKKLSPQKVALILSDLGFERHPQLPDGKISVVGRRTRLYSRVGSYVGQITDKEKILETIYPTGSVGY
jgi:hypothetical protein